MTREEGGMRKIRCRKGLHAENEGEGRKNGGRVHRADTQVEKPQNGVVS